MNNIRQKNVMQELQTNVDMPYIRHQFVDLQSNNPSINSIDVNNSLQQLLDNDLYLESKLTNTSSYIIGPKVYDENTIEYMQNGYKAYGDIHNSEELDILHKVDKELSSTVTKSKAFTGNVDLVFQYGNLTFASDENGLKYSLDPKNDKWESFDARINVRDYTTTGNSLIFAAKQGVYQLSTYVNFDLPGEDAGKTCYSLFKINENEVYDVHSLAFDQKNYRLLICSQVKENQFQLFEAQYFVLDDYSEIVRKVKFGKKNLFSGSNALFDKINKMSFFKNGKVLLAGNDGIYYQDIFKQFLNMVLLKSEDTGIDYRRCIEFSNKLYIQTQNRVYVRSGEYEISQVKIGGNDDINSQVINVTDMNVLGAYLYISTINSDMTSHLYRVDVNDIWEDLFSSILNTYEFSNNTEITKIRQFNSTNVLLGTSHGVYSLNLNTYDKLKQSYLNLIDIPEVNAQRINDVYYNSSSKALYIGTNSDFIVQKVNSTEQSDTTVVSTIDRYSKDTLRQDTIKIETSRDQSFIITKKSIQSINKTSEKWLCSDSDEYINDAVLVDNITELAFLVCTNKKTYLLNVTPKNAIQFTKILPGEFKNICKIAIYKDMILLNKLSDIIILSKNSLFDILVYNSISLQNRNLLIDENIHVMGTDNNISCFGQNPVLTNSNMLSGKNITQITLDPETRLILYSTEDGLSANRIALEEGEHEEEYEVHTNGMLITESSNYSWVGKIGDLHYLFNATDNGVFQCDFNSYSDDVLENIKESYHLAAKVSDKVANTICHIEDFSTTVINSNEYSKVLIGTNDGIYYKDLVKFKLEQVNPTRIKHMAVFTKTKLAQAVGQEDEEKEITLSSDSFKKAIAMDDSRAYTIKDNGRADVWDLRQSDGTFYSQDIGLDNVNDIALIKPYSPGKSEETPKMERDDEYVSFCYDLIAAGNKVYTKKLMSYDYSEQLLESSSDILNLDIVDFSSEELGIDSIAFGIAACRDNIYFSQLSVYEHETNYKYSFQQFQTVEWADGVEKIENITKALFSSSSTLLIVTDNRIFDCQIEQTTDKKLKITSARIKYDSDIASKISMVYKPSSNYNPNKIYELHGVYDGKYIINIENFKVIAEITGQIYDEYWHYKYTKNDYGEVISFDIFYYVLGSSIFKLALDDKSQFLQTSQHSKINYLYAPKDQNLRIYVIYNDSYFGYIEDFNTFEIHQIKKFDINIRSLNVKNNIIYLIASDNKYIYSIECDDDLIPIEESLTKYIDLTENENIANGLIVNEKVIIDGIEIDLFSKLVGYNNYNENVFIYGKGFQYIYGYSLLKSEDALVNAFDLFQNDENDFEYITLDKQKLFYKDELHESPRIIEYGFRSNGLFFIKSNDNKWYYGKNLNTCIPFTYVNDNRHDINSYALIKKENILCTTNGTFSVDFLKNTIIRCLEYIDYKMKVLQFDQKNSKDSKMIVETSSLKKINIYDFSADSFNEYKLSSKYDITTVESDGKIQTSSIYEVPGIEFICFCENQTNTIFMTQKPVSDEYLQNLSSTYKIDGITRKADFSKGREDLNYTQRNVLEYYEGIELNDVNSIYATDGNTYISYGPGILTFEKYAQSTGYQRVYGSNGQSYYNIVDVDMGSPIETKLINGSIYINTFDENDLFFVKQLSSRAFTEYDFQEGKKYILQSGKNVLTSDNYKTWNSLLSLTVDIDHSNSIYPMDKNTYFFATDNGLYFTKYTYDIKHDIKSFTQEEALDLYDQVMTQRGGISALVSTCVSNHISIDHDVDSMITQLNTNYIDTNMEDIIHWQKSNDQNDCLVINNDIIAEMVFGEYEDGDITIQISNFITTSDEPDEQRYIEIQNFNYIMKRWMSGITELFINIPTTSTYYLPDLYGASDCRISPETRITRKNLSEFDASKQDQDGVLSTHYTDIVIGVLSSEYHIDNILDMQINGNSLPLKIYKMSETTNSSGQLYRSFAQPSVIKNYDIQKTDEYGNYKFNFACFGTDAQAIKIAFYDQSSRISKPWIRVVFDANGGEGKMSKQKFLIDEETGTLIQKPLKANKFKNTSAGYPKIFIGWTLTPQPDNYSPTSGLDDGTQIYTKDGEQGIFPHQTDFKKLMEELIRSEDQSFIEKEEITLYAVWITYQFSDSDTTLLLNSDKTDFHIDYVEVDKSTNLKDNVAISFGEK